MLKWQKTIRTNWAKLDERLNASGLYSLQELAELHDFRARGIAENASSLHDRRRAQIFEARARHLRRAIETGFEGYDKQCKK